MPRKSFSTGPFDTIPDRVALSDSGFNAAFAEYERAEQAAGRKATIEKVAEAAGADTRVLRAVRAGEKTLPFHQAEKMARLMGCAIDDIVANPYQKVRAEGRTRHLAELKAWPVPLNEVTSWKAFTADLAKCQVVDVDHAENSVDLTTAAAIQAIADLLRSGRDQAKTAPVLLEAGLKDAAAELTEHGLHVLVGRYVGRHVYGTNQAELSGVGLHLAMVVRVRREVADPDFVLDRSGEPLTVSDIEDHYADDRAANEMWLAWEGKRRLALWDNEDWG